MAWAGSARSLPALLISRLWFNSRMSSCQVDGPGTIPGSRTNSSQAARQQAAQSSKLSLPGAAPGRLTNFHLGAWQKSDAPALQAGSSRSVTGRPPPIFGRSLKECGGPNRHFQRRPKPAVALQFLVREPIRLSRDAWHATYNRRH